MDQCWSEENRDGYFPRFRGYQTFAGSQLGVNNDRYLQDASYIRLKNLTVGYTLPVLKKVFTKLRVYFTGENLWYWSPETGRKIIGIPISLTYPLKEDT